MMQHGAHDTAPHAFVKAVHGVRYQVTDVALSGPVLLTLWAHLIVATVGVLIGTIVGERMLLGLSARRFGQTIGAAIGVLGVWLLVMPL